MPFHVTGRGITTRPMTDGVTIFTIDFDFLDHRIDITALTGDRYSFLLAGQSVAGFYDQIRSGLSNRPFAEDTEHASYDPSAVTRYWRVLSQVNLLLEAFAASYSGKTSPVHHFWHTFDIAVTRFGGTRVEHSATTDPVTREAYSRDVISFGFWFGDDSFSARRMGHRPLGVPRRRHRTPDHHRVAHSIEKPIVAKIPYQLQTKVPA